VIKIERNWRGQVDESTWLELKVCGGMSKEGGWPVFGTLVIESIE
jgi:hypothetical protein